MNNPESMHTNDVKVRNIIIRVCSVICAVLLWIYVTAVDTTDSESTFSNVSVSIENRAALQNNFDLALISSSNTTTNITLSGKRSTLNKLDVSDIKVYVDLSQIESAGKHKLKIEVSAPEGTTLISTSPQYAEITVDDIDTRSFPIEVVDSYTNSNGYEVGEPVISHPSTGMKIEFAEIKGPVRELDSIERVVARADFGRVQGTVDTKTDLIMYNSSGEEIHSLNLSFVDTRSVKITLPLYTTKIISLAVEQAYNTFPDSKINFSISPQRIAVTGDPGILNSLDTLYLDPFNEKNIGENLSGSLTCTINLPSGVSADNGITTATVTARLLNVTKHTVQYPTSSIETKNLSPQLELSFHEDFISLVAISADSSSLDDKDLIVTLDLASITEKGTYTKNVTATTIERVSYGFVVTKDITYPVTFTLS